MSLRNGRVNHTWVGRIVSSCLKLQRRCLDLPDIKPGDGKKKDSWPVLWLLYFPFLALDMFFTSVGIISTDIAGNWYRMQCFLLLSMVVLFSSMQAKQSFSSPYWRKVDRRLKQFSSASVATLISLYSTTTILLLFPRAGANHLVVLEKVIELSPQTYYFLLFSSVYSALFFATCLAVYLYKRRERHPAVPLF